MVRALLALLVAAFAFAAFAQSAKVKTTKQDYHIDGTDPGVRLFVRQKMAQGNTRFTDDNIVLFIHGATAPSTCDFDLGFKDYSWADWMIERGYVAYMFDKRNYGYSSREKAMDEPPANNKPVSRSYLVIRDIGAATAERLARAGARVAVGDRDEAVARELAAELTKTTGSTVVAGALDVASPSSWTAFLSAVSDLGPVDVLINNAGFGGVNWFEKFKPERDIEIMTRVNLIGTMLVTHAVLPHMLNRREGHIINMVSVAGLIAAPTITTYSAGKYGVRAFTDALDNITSC